MSTSATATETPTPSSSRSPSPGRRSRWRRLGAGLLAGALIAGLGGCYVGVGYTWSDDDPPEVGLTARPDSARPGATIELVATASDDDAVERVEFFRLGSSGAVYLGSDFSAPYTLDTRLPETSASSVSYFARAVDRWGQRSDSDWVRVTVLR